LIQIKILRRLVTLRRSRDGGGVGDECADRGYSDLFIATSCDEAID
jgi:hypothetical protein